MATPANARLSAKIRGSRRVKAHLARYAAAVPAILAQGRLEKMLLRRTKDRFRTKKAPDGKAWKDLKDITAAQKTTGKSKPLIRSGEMYKAIEVVRSTMGEASLRSPTGAGFTIGIVGEAVTRARAHQFGARKSGKGGRSRIPQRRFLGIGKEDVTAVNRLLRRLWNKEVGSL
ncbi:MAG: phage virion morphogenesis protein [Zetaproteobacteria bacterium]|nr:phage virion morphogenesis protein [Zetaproteobacteria bacterium]